MNKRIREKRAKHLLAHMRVFAKFPLLKYPYTEIERTVRAVYVRGTAPHAAFAKLGKSLFNTWLLGQLRTVGQLGK